MIRSSEEPHATIQQTTNFLWSTADMLGQGATSRVYRGMDKKTGKEYAIKVFNSRNAGTRFAAARKREFDVLKKINHVNVIRLFKIEQELTSRQDVIIMELCTGGNLQSMLDDPENLHGLEEYELKRVLKHLTNGMKHLYERKVVHRDLKPGNITRTITEDGSSVYKLTDFGAARILGYEEQFQSLCGTEEYLHPDIYARAILRKPPGKKFSATVDLWSIGVTLYQVATGELPFRPYGGARRNKEIMHKITMEKPPGVISGIQLNEGGDIEWSRELPKSCRLSPGFKQLFTQLLRGILERDPHFTWSFERFFAEVDKILSMKVIDVFCIPSASLHKIYIQPDQTFAAFQLQLEKMANIRSSSQLLLFDGAVFHVDPHLPVCDYPSTSPDHPLILVSRNIMDFHKISIPHTSKPPRFKSSSMCDNDASLAKICSKCLFDIEKTVGHLLLVQDLVRISVKWFVSYLKSCLVQVRLACGETESKLKCLKTSLEIFEEHYRQETSLLRVISKVVSTPPVVNELTLYFVQITEKANYLRKIRKDFDEIENRISQLERSIIDDEVPKSVFIDVGSQPEDRLKERIGVCSKKSREIYKVLKTPKSFSLSGEEKQKHVFEKRKLSELCESSISLLIDKSVPDCRNLHKESTSWFINNMSECLNEIEGCGKKLAKLCRRLDEQAEPVRKLQKVYQDKMTVVEEFLYNAIDREENSNAKLRISSSLGCRSANEKKKSSSNWKRLSLPSLPTGGASLP